jgi:phosphinothricin acetyltransferase
VIRSASVDDAEAVSGIYNYYVLNTIVTFEEQPVTVGEMRQRIADVTARFPWLIALDQGRAVGYGYASLWKSRSAYRRSLESTIYLDPNLVGRGIGTHLYGALLRELAARDIHSVVGGIALPNPASIALHERMGFEKVAHFREAGQKFGRWIDVGYWQLIL